MAVDLDRSELYRLAPEHYQRMVELALFDEAPVELIDGLLVALDVKTAAHENAVSWLTGVLGRNLEHERYELRVHSPLSLQRSVPEPDLAVVDRHAPRPWHPSTAELVIEICAGSLERHLGGKAAVYAAARVPAYWVIDLTGAYAVCHSQPDTGGYGQVSTLRPNERLSAGVAGVPTILVADALAAAAGPAAGP